MTPIRLGINGMGRIGRLALRHALARATAGECRANFVNVGLHEVLDMWIGNSERQLHAVFEEARRRAPTVLFFDEVDTILADPASTDVLWARFYDLKTAKPIFAGADDGIVYSTFQEMAAKNKVAYDFFSTRPAELLGKELPRWRKRLEKGK